MVLSKSSTVALKPSIGNCSRLSAWSPGDRGQQTILLRCGWRQNMQVLNKINTCSIETNGVQLRIVEYMFYIGSRSKIDRKWFEGQQYSWGVIFPNIPVLDHNGSISKYFLSSLALVHK